MSRKEMEISVEPATNSGEAVIDRKSKSITGIEKWEIELIDMGIIYLPALRGSPKIMPTEMTSGSRSTMPKLTRKLKTASERLDL